jgi:hypothetical protein
MEQKQTIEGGVQETQKGIEVYDFARLRSVSPLQNRLEQVLRKWLKQYADESANTWQKVDRMLRLMRLSYTTNGKGKHPGTLRKIKFTMKDMK